MQAMLPRGVPFFSDFLTYYSLVWNACVVAVKCHPVLYHYVVIFVWSSEIIDCIFLNCISVEKQALEDVVLLKNYIFSN